MRFTQAGRRPEIYNDDAPAFSEKEKYQKTIFFPIGEPNPYGDFFVGKSYLCPLSTEQIPLFNVTFEPCCRNNWHVHCAKNGGGQMLICVGGRGIYQEWGKAPVILTPLLTAGSRILPWKYPVKILRLNGAKRSRTGSISRRSNNV